MEHTKEKWEIMTYTRRDADNIRWVKTVSGKTICQTFKPNAEAKAREIVLCHNAFEPGGIVEELRTACEAMMKAWWGTGDCRSMHQLKTDMDAAYEEAEAALAKI